MVYIVDFSWDLQMPPSIISVRIVHWGIGRKTVGIQDHYSVKLLYYDQFPQISNLTIDTPKLAHKNEVFWSFLVS